MRSITALLLLNVVVGVHAQDMRNSQTLTERSQKVDRIAGVRGVVVKVSKFSALTGLAL